LHVLTGPGHYDKVEGTRAGPRASEADRETALGSREGDQRSIDGRPNTRRGNAPERSSWNGARYAHLADGFGEGPRGRKPAPRAGVAIDQNRHRN
jgi:hypothetical protein